MADSEVRQKEWTINRTARLIRKIAACEGISAKLILMWHFYESAYSAGMRAGEIARWIPVEEKLPDTGVGVLMSVDGRTQYGYRRSCPGPRAAKWAAPNRAISGNVTHWQPLPAAPEEKK